MKEKFKHTLISNAFGQIYFSQKVDTGEFIIFNLFIYPRNRRNGHARKLMKQAIALIEMEDPEVIHIEAISSEEKISNIELADFYSQFGFITKSGNGEVGYTMERRYR